MLARFTPEWRARYEKAGITASEVARWTGLAKGTVISIAKGNTEKPDPLNEDAIIAVLETVCEHCKRLWPEQGAERGRIIRREASKREAKGRKDTGR